MCFIFPQNELSINLGVEFESEIEYWKIESSSNEATNSRRFVSSDLVMDVEHVRWGGFMAGLTALWDMRL